MGDQVKIWKKFSESGIFFASFLFWSTSDQKSILNFNFLFTVKTANCRKNTA